MICGPTIHLENWLLRKRCVFFGLFFFNLTFICLDYVALSHMKTCGMVVYKLVFKVNYWLLSVVTLSFSGQLCHNKLGVNWVAGFKLSTWGLLAFHFCFQATLSFMVSSGRAHISSFNISYSPFNIVTWFIHLQSSCSRNTKLSYKKLQKSLCVLS